jgi:peptide chain release factor subunit 1
MINRKKIIELLQFRTETDWVLSFFLGVGVYKAQRKAYETEAKSIIKEAVNAAELSGDDRKKVEEDARKILRFLTMDFKGKARGLAVFACGPAGLWQVFRLPVTVPDRCVIDHMPYVLPMLRLVDEGRRYCVVVADKEKARLFTLYMGEITERTDIFDGVPGWHKQGGWAQARFQRHIEDQVNKHLKHVADTVFELYKREGFGHLIIGGTHELSTRLYRILHSYLQKIVRGYITVDVSANINDILKAAREIEDDTQNKEVSEMAQRLLGPSRQGNLAVKGLDDTIQALTEGRVHTLVLADSYEVEGCLCGDCGGVDLMGAEKCTRCMKKLSKVGDVSEHLAIMAVEQDAEVKYLPQGLGLESEGGVGAILRW